MIWYNQPVEVTSGRVAPMHVCVHPVSQEILQTSSTGWLAPTTLSRAGLMSVDQTLKSQLQSLLSIAKMTGIVSRKTFFRLMDKPPKCTSAESVLRDDPVDVWQRRRATDSLMSLNAGEPWWQSRFWCKSAEDAGTTENQLHDETYTEKAQADQKLQYEATYTKIAVSGKVLVQTVKNVGRKGGKLELHFILEFPTLLPKTLGKVATALKMQMGSC